mgnify:CR=1 FL=1
MTDKLSIRILPFVKINLLIFPIVISALIFDYYPELALSYLCALLHETAHILCAVLLKIKISYIEFKPFGVCAKLASDIILSPAREIAVALSGPLISLFMAGGAHLSACAPEYFVICNLSLAAINLLPALPLDGGRVLRAALTIKSGAVRAYDLSLKISRVPIFSVICLSVYALLVNKFNFSLILIGTFLLGNLFAEQYNISRSALRELMHYKDKLNREDLNRVRVICGHKSMPARKILRLLSYDKYYIIHITDDDTKVVKTISEGEIITAITERGVRITLGEI